MDGPYQTAADKLPLFGPVQNIALDTNASKELWVGEGAFMVIVYQLRYRHVPSRQLDALMTRATGKIKDMITPQFQESFPISHTLQMEGKQFYPLCIHKKNLTSLRQCLNQLKRFLIRIKAPIS